MKKFIKIMAVVAISTSFFVGCSSSDEGTETNTESTESTDTTETTDDSEATEDADTTEDSETSDATTEDAEPTEDAMMDVGMIDPVFAVPESEADLPQRQELEEGDTIATLKTNQGDIICELFPEYAPKAVENFTTHAEEGYYDGLTFHRVIDQFMIQGGDPNGDGTGGESIWGEPFEDEFSNSLRNFNGALSMANSGTNTNGSQFFIVENNQLDDTTIDSLDSYKENQDEVIQEVDDGYNVRIKNLYPEPVIDVYEEVGGTPHLDFAHTVFGQVVDGMDVVENIAEVETDENDMPLEPIIIETIEISQYGE